MTPDAQIRPLEAHDIDRAAATLTDAFAQYAWTRWIIPDANYLDRLFELQRIYLTHATEHGLVLASDDITGVAALLPADAPHPSAETMERIVELHGDRIERLGASLADAQEAPSGSWVLETLGVRQARHGQGLGSRLITSAVAEASARSASAITLETSDPRNVALYERHGFRTTLHEPAGEAPAAWAMCLETLRV